MSPRRSSADIVVDSNPQRYLQSSGEATHRVLVQLNRGWRDDQGGFLMFFNSGDPADVHRVFSPTHDSVVGFAISEDSHHAVSTIHGGERFTLVFSFYGRNDG